MVSLFLRPIFPFIIIILLAIDLLQTSSQLAYFFSVVLSDIFTFSSKLFSPISIAYYLSLSN